jgi:UDP-GlcNAc:undecaprenyl-phosphate GlcNAc-1-phosphate transferase
MDVTDYLLVAGVAFATVALGTPVVSWLCRRVGAVAIPSERSIHRTPIPTLGGLAIFAGVLAAFGLGAFLPSFNEVFLATSEPEAVVLASLVIVVVGVIDDTRGLSAPAKVAGQVLAAGILSLFGVVLRYVYVPGFNVAYVPGVETGPLITILLLLAIMNAVNVIDGLDGLAAGIVAIAAAALFVYTVGSQADVAQSPSTGPLLLAGVIGACLGFLVHNFNPASIFMGDTGAMLLGLLLGSAGISAVGSQYIPDAGSFTATTVPILVPILVLAIPFVDITWAVLRRLAKGQTLYSPDKQHIHHRLLDWARSQRRAVLVLYYFSGLVAFAAVGGGLVDRYVLVGILAGGLGLAAMVVAGSRIARRLEEVRTR